MRVVEADYENGVLRPIDRLQLRDGERVRLIVMRDPDPARWDLEKLAKTANGEGLSLAEQGLAEWVKGLETEDQT